VSLSQILAGQLRRPEGALGYCLGKAMALVNERANSLAIDRLGLRPHDQVLELGFGPGRAIARMASHVTSGRVCGIDQSVVMLRQATRRNAEAILRGRVRLVQGNFERLPFPDASFDRVLAVNVAYFWPEGCAILREVGRVTRPGARIALYATHRRTMEKWRITRGGCHRLYDEEEMRALLDESDIFPARIEVQTFPMGFGVRGICAIAEKAAPDGDALSQAAWQCGEAVT
jgi:SAM-dependent methyltransferase